jgi:hypothetical protein
MGFLVPLRLRGKEFLSVPFGLLLAGMAIQQIKKPVK